MHSLLNALYDLLSFITEDAVAWKIGKIPPALLEQMNSLTVALGEYLDEQERLDIECGE